MVWRILKGQRSSGTFGFDVSKPGFDVTTANIMQMAFTSDYRIPKVVIKGTVVAGPTNGRAPQGVGVYPGAAETVTTIGFGRTVSAPAIFAIASAPSWNVPLAAAPTAQLGALANQWHTYVLEWMPNSGVTFDGTYGVNIRRNLGAGYVTNEVEPTWASARFAMYGFSDRIEFHTNCSSNLTIKYLVLEQP
jgi:hypothetical protein